jgi:hypothetical protein
MVADWQECRLNARAAGSWVRRHECGADGGTLIGAAVLFGARTGQAAQRPPLRTLMERAAALLGLLVIIFGGFHLGFATGRDKR